MVAHETIDDLLVGACSWAIFCAGCFGFDCIIQIPLFLVAFLGLSLGGYDPADPPGKAAAAEGGVVVKNPCGPVGAALANWLLGLLGIALPFGGWVNYLIAGFIGACIIIALWRMIRSRS